MVKKSATCFFEIFGFRANFPSTHVLEFRDLFFRKVLKISQKVQQSATKVQHLILLPEISST
jgi:hypothetical protein